MDIIKSYPKKSPKIRSMVHRFRSFNSFSSLPIQSINIHIKKALDRRDTKITNTIKRGIERKVKANSASILLLYKIYMYYFSIFN